MKTQKIISLTMAIVAVVLISMLGVSKFFESSWQSENTVDNSLSAEIADNSESVFNYPFVSAQQAVDDGYNPAREPLEASKQYGSIYEDYMIDIQQAVNTAGETIKFLTGYTGHQNIPVMAHLVNQAYTDDGIYRIMHYKNFVSDTPEEIKSDFVKGFDVLIHPATGEVYRILVYYDFDVDVVSLITDNNFSKAKEMEVIDYVSDVLALINNNDGGEITDINIQRITDGVYNRFQVRFKYNEIPYWITLEEPFGNSVYYVQRFFSNYE